MKKRTEKQKAQAKPKGEKIDWNQNEK